MARTQFTFTFTNAQPGAAVGFNFPAYADASTPVADGPSVVLDSTNTVSVWADSEYLIARTVDGRGVEIVGVATVAYPTQTIDAGVPGASPFPGGSGSVREYTFAFTHATAGLATGVVAYTPTGGDTLIDAWVEITTAWNGTTPYGDVGSFAGVNFGWFDGNYLPLDMTAADTASSGTGLAYCGSPGDSVNTSGAVNLASMNLISVTSVPPHLTRAAPGKFTTADPIKVCVSQDGTNTGASPAATQGAAVLHLIVSTPTASPG